MTVTRLSFKAMKTNLSLHQCMQYHCMQTALYQFYKLTGILFYTMSTIPGGIVARLMDQDAMKVLSSWIVFHKGPSRLSPSIHPVPIIVKVVYETLPGSIRGVPQLGVSHVPAVFEGVQKCRVKVLCLAVHELLHRVEHVHSCPRPVNYLK